MANGHAWAGLRVRTDHGAGRRRTSPGGAADLAALAAADHWMEGREEACAHATWVAVTRNARLVRCVVVRGGV
ncbi:hypothetical protein [Streptomyces sp. NPDC055105]|uniref:hypothetical protein n=1 Tax=Streptomyces sp. NPDC055105 TaxID=3365719 RepID=UPI0037D29F27